MQHIQCYAIDVTQIRSSFAIYWPRQGRRALSIPLGTKFERYHSHHTDPVLSRSTNLIVVQIRDCQLAILLRCHGDGDDRTKSQQLIPFLMKVCPIFF